METYRRKQLVFGGSMAKNDEVRAIDVMVKTLGQLDRPARRRCVRYLVDRFLTNEDPEPAERSTPSGAVTLPPPAPPPSREESLAIARERLGA